MAVAERIHMEPVESSNLLNVGYNAEKQILAVEFKSGAIYHHAPFTPDQQTEFLEAGSLGRHYNTVIKGKVPGRKMTGECPDCGDKPGWIGETCGSCGCAVYADAPRQSER